MSEKKEKPKSNPSGFIFGLGTIAVSVWIIYEAIKLYTL